MSAKFKTPQVNDIRDELVKEETLAAYDRAQEAMVAAHEAVGALLGLGSPVLGTFNQQMYHDLAVASTTYSRVVIHAIAVGKRTGLWE